MFRTQGFFSIETSSRLAAMGVFLLNLGLYSIVTMIVGALLHIGWNWA